MVLRLAVTIAANAFAAVLYATQVDAASSAHLTLHSQPGDYIGQAQDWDIVYPSAEISLSSYRTLANGDPTVLFFQVGHVVQEPNTYATLWFGTDQLGIKMQPGVYLNAERAVFASAGHPGLDVNFQNRGCNTVSGSFTVTEATFIGTVLESFAATFEQHCEGGLPALFGTFTYSRVTPPTITSQPSSQTITVHQAAALHVDAASPLPVSYQWYRGASGNTIAPIGGATLNSYTTPLLASTANYWARVTNADGSTDSATATITVTRFTDDPLVAGSTVMKAAHITELRAGADALRALFGLGPFAWTDPTLTAGTAVVLAQHVIDLRLALTQIYDARALTRPTFTDPGLSPGTTARVIHIAELRALIPFDPFGVSLDASATSGPGETIVTLTATVAGLGEAVAVVGYFWEFGNGDAPHFTTTNQITHPYPHGSVSYTVRVTVYSSIATTASDTLDITP
jgi:hypothetical protein